MSTHAISTSVIFEKLPEFSLYIKKVFICIIAFVPIKTEFVKKSLIAVFKLIYA